MVQPTTENDPGRPLARQGQPQTGPLRNLATVGWLSEQPPEFQGRIARAGRWVTFARGKPLFVVGDPSRAMYGLGEGLLDVSVPINDDEEVTVQRAGPGFWIGDAGLLSNSPRSISVRAALDCRVFKLSLAALNRDLAEHPEDWKCLARLGFQNASLCVRVLAEIIVLPPRARFARTLLRLASDGGHVRITQEELGRMIGMSRASFRRSFASLIELGIIQTEYGGLRIVDRPALEAEADG